MRKIAIIGTGIAGMACAHRLHSHFDISVFEKNSYVGGHTNTVVVKEDGRDIPIDTGFMVFNNHTYPQLIQLFNDLGVETKDTNMSFGVQVVRENLEYACSGLNTFFAQRKRLLSIRHWQLLFSIIQFFKQANRFHESGDMDDLSLGAYLEKLNVSRDVAKRFFLPMVAAIWSTPTENMMDYPASTLIRFMKNHGLLGVGTQFTWRTVVGGSRSYRDRIIAPYKSKIISGKPVRAVIRKGYSVDVMDDAGERRSFDAVIIATHADQALSLLENPTNKESLLLSCFKYNKNPVVLHSDESVMPRSRQAWASWNYRIDGDEEKSNSSTHYWMNRLQDVSQNKNYFVSVDYTGSIREDAIHWRTLYEHPRFDHEAINAQKSLSELNEVSSVFFCGSYFRYGFHEDALMSANALCDTLLKRKGCA